MADGWGREPSGGGVVVAKVAAEFAGGLGLGEEFPGLGLDALDGVGTGDETQRRIGLG